MLVVFGSYQKKDQYGAVTCETVLGGGGEGDIC
jgi:hypothetical protein